MRFSAKEVCACALLLLTTCIVDTCAAKGYATTAGCQSLSTLVLPHAKVTLVQPVTDGSFKPPGFPLNLGELPPFCRVAISSFPTPDSLIRIEVWIPLGKTWNGKYLQRDCGGFCGELNYSALAFAVRRGYASAVTDDGHQKAGGYLSFATGQFALGHPQKVIDFGYRALKETTNDAKRVIAAYRRGGPKYSYFMGCSNGGREALMEAQRYPDDFNGIIVGAPASNWTREMAGGLWNEQALLDKPASYIPLAKLPLLSRAVLAQCRKHDTGAPGDDFLTDPVNCHFNPGAIQCAAGQNPDTCLTHSEVKAVEAIYSGPRDPKSGKQIAAGFIPTGNEAMTWPMFVVGSSREADLKAGSVTPNWLSIKGHTAGALQFFFGSQYFADFVYQDPKSFDFRTVDLREAVERAEEGPGKVIDATNPDLRPFKAHGGKLIQYDGWADPILTAWTSVNYYNRVNAFMYGESPSRSPASYKAIQSFYRLFMVPGMSHCGAGAGPNAFGNDSKPPALDPQHDVLTALDRWVTHGVAPKEFIGTHYIDNDPEKGIQFQRPLCRYPEVAHYDGDGNPADASSFTCR